MEARVLHCLFDVKDDAGLIECDGLRLRACEVDNEYFEGDRVDHTSRLPLCSSSRKIKINNGIGDCQYVFGRATGGTSRRG